LGGHADLRAAWQHLEPRLSAATPECEARRLAEDMARVLQGALLVQHAPAVIADLFCATRLGGQGGVSYGVLPQGAETASVIRRQRGG
jgi:putative acyl-CoA dehydrogenase